MTKKTSTVQHPPVTWEAYPRHGRRDLYIYEMDDVQLSTDTATVWALHLRVDQGAKGEVKRAVGTELPPDLTSRITGEFTYGDSWEQWGEECQGDDDIHMVIYYKAAPEEACAVGTKIAESLCATRDRFAVSTAGDYAEQLEPDLVAEEKAAITSILNRGGS